MHNTSLSLNSLPGLLRSNRRFFAIFGLVAIAFRVFFLLKFRLMTNDSFIYGDIAKNWLHNGIYGQTYAAGPESGYIRLPGYPLFLVLVWLVAGLEHYTAVLIVQVVVDVLTCFVIADLARRIATPRAAKAAFVMAALCPLFANYAAVVLTETLAIFFSALAMDMAVAAFDEPGRKRWWMLCGGALGAGILLRPDGGMLLGVVGIYALIVLVRSQSSDIRRKVFFGTAALGLIALAPLIPWTIRNWRVFHTFQPLAPFNANMPDEFVPRGFHRWARTWMADYASCEDVLFRMDGEPVSIDDLPPRAWDNEDQKARTEQLFNDYQENGNTTSPQIDAGFAALAQERIDASALRYYLKMPLMRAADLWLRPHTEMLPIDPHWWRLSEDDPPQFAEASVLGAINLFYVLAAMLAAARGKVRYLGFFLLFAILRTAFMAWLPNTEPRYMLECYPALLAIAGALFSGRKRKQQVVNSHLPLQQPV